MKILMLCDKMDIGGAETHILTLISELRKMGVDITLVCAGGIYIKNITLMGIRYRYAPLDKRDGASALAARAVISEELQRCNIIHAHTRFSAFMAKSARRGAYPPIVVTAHLNFPTFPFGALSYWGDAALAVSRDIKEHLINAYKLAPEKIFMTRNSIDLDLYENKGARKKLIIHTSRIDTGRAKAAFMLAEIAPHLLKIHPEYKILIVGDGNRFGDLKEAASVANRKLGTEGVILAGARADIPHILGFGNIFVGVSRAALEGMAAGLATVIAGDEGYGGIIDKENFDALALGNFCARGLSPITPERLISDISELIESKKARDELRDFYKSVLRGRYSANLMANDAYRVYLSLFRTPRVCLMGYFGYSNLGDELTLDTAILALGARNIRDISVISARSAGEYGDGIRYYNRTSPRDIARAVRECDIFIMCGGNLLQNETSERSLIYYANILAYARSRKKIIYMLSSGFGDVRGGFSNMLLSRGVGSSAFCGCRTGYDLSIAKAGGAKNAVLMPDLCFLLGEGKRCADAKFFAYVPSRDCRISPKRLIEIGKARGLLPIVVILFPKDDRTASESFTNSGISCYFPKSYEKLGSIFSACAFTVCERLHGAIFSMLFHTPAYISTRQTKNRALFSEIAESYPNQNILIPYTENAVLRKKEIGVRDSDFSAIINDLRKKVLNGINAAF